MAAVRRTAQTRAIADNESDRGRCRPLLGFRLVGGRLLPFDGKPGAMFMYKDQGGERRTVLVGRDAGDRTTSFRFASADNLETFYWIDGELGYAVTGEISRGLLRQVAEECYEQFAP